MSPRRPILLVACVLLTAAPSAAAQAATAIRLQTTGDLPFTSDELEQAVGARLTMSAAAGAELVTVGPIDESGVSVRMGEREAVVPIGAHSGLAAARVVALAIAEIAAETPESADAEASETAAPTVVAPPGSGPPSIATPSPPPHGTTSPQEVLVRLSLAVGAAKGTASNEPFTWTGEATAAFPRRGFDIVAGLGVWDMPKRDERRPDEVSFVAGVVRAGAGRSVGPVQVAVGPFVAPYRLKGPLISHTGVLAGGGAMARAGWKPFAASSVELFGALRVDVFANRVRVAAGSPDGFASPRLAATLAIGIGWDLGI